MSYKVDLIDMEHSFLKTKRIGRMDTWNTVQLSVGFSIIP
jgi:hypothetical protein